MMLDGQSPWLTTSIALCLLVAVVAEVCMTWQRDRGQVAGSDSDAATAVATVAAALCLALGPVASAGSLLAGQGVVAAGLALAVVGTGLRIWAIRALDGLFSPRLEVRTDHRLVVSGPYRFVQHPGYTGALLLFVGLALALGRPLALAAVVPLVLAVAVRATREERLLAPALGPAYAAYREGTGRFLPRSRPPMTSRPLEPNEHGRR